MQNTNPQGARTKKKIKIKKKKKEGQAVSLLSWADVYHCTAGWWFLFWLFCKASQCQKWFFYHCTAVSLVEQLQLFLSQTSCEDNYLNNLEISLNL